MRISDWSSDVCSSDLIHSAHDVLKLIEQFHARYGERFGKGSQAPEAGIRINTLRVCSYVEHPGIAFAGIKPTGTALPPPPKTAQRACHFVGHDGALQTAIYDDKALAPGTTIDGPVIVVTRAPPYLIEPGCRYQAAAQDRKSTH